MGNSRRWTEEERRELERLAALGLPDVEVSAKLNRTIYAVRKARSKMNIAKAGPTSKKNPASRNSKAGGYLADNPAERPRTCPLSLSREVAARVKGLLDEGADPENVMALVMRMRGIKTGE